MKARNRDIQRRIAYEAARILTENRSADQIYAIHKAASRLGINSKKLLPNRDEVDAALREQQRLFRGDAQQDAVESMRIAALQAMKVFSRFNPLLTGPVYEGTADINSRISLYLFASTPEEVALHLMSMHIPWHEKDCSIRFTDGSRKSMPSFRFVADNNHFELIILSDKGLNNRPTDPLNNKPIKGLTAHQLEKILNQR